MIDRANRKREQVIAVLLTAGKAAPRYIDLAADWLDGEEVSSGARKFVLTHLSKALTFTLSAAPAYLVAPRDERRRRLVLRSLAIGIKWKPQALPSLLDKTISQLSDHDANAMLSLLVDCGITAEPLQAFVAARLAKVYRRRGYGYILTSVQRNATFRNGLLAKPNLDPRVRADLRRPDEGSSTSR